MGEGLETVAVIEKSANDEIVSSSIRLLTVDSGPTATPVITGGDKTTNDTTPTITGTAEAGSSVVVKLGTAAQTAVTADSSGNWSYTHGSALADGSSNSFTAVSTDTAGNAIIFSQTKFKGQAKIITMG